jgi:hypothetical protein
MDAEELWVPVGMYDGRGVYERFVMGVVTLADL